MKQNVCVDDISLFVESLDHWTKNNFISSLSLSRRCQHSRSRLECSLQVPVVLQRGVARQGSRPTGGAAHRLPGQLRSWRRQLPHHRPQPRRARRLLRQQLCHYRKHHQDHRWVHRVSRGKLTIGSNLAESIPVWPKAESSPALPNLFLFCQIDSHLAESFPIWPLWFSFERISSSSFGIHLISPKITVHKNQFF